MAVWESLTWNRSQVGTTIADGCDSVLCSGPVRGPQMSASRQPKTDELQKRYSEAGLRDLKFLYDGKSSDDVSIEDLSAEVLAILDADDKGLYVDSVDAEDKLK